MRHSPQSHSPPQIIFSLFDFYFSLAQLVLQQEYMYYTKKTSLDSLEGIPVLYSINLPDIESQNVHCDISSLSRLKAFNQK